jgi:uncharacterized LabA/DUF88 family protein
MKNNFHLDINNISKRVNVNRNFYNNNNVYKHKKHNSNIQVPGMAYKSNAGLPNLSADLKKESNKRAIVFVDANNWYHNLKLLFKPRKLQRLSNKEILKRKKEIIENLDLCNNFRPLIEASFLDLADIKRKEKGIDVWIAIDMIKKSIIDNQCDICILISGYTDFVPAVNLIKQAGKQVLSAFIPFEYSTELRNSTQYFIIRKETLIKCFRDYQKNKENQGPKKNDEIDRKKECLEIIGGDKNAN